MNNNITAITFGGIAMILAVLILWTGANLAVYATKKIAEQNVIIEALELRVDALEKNQVACPWITPQEVE